jgi:hypothetical protein
MMGNQREENEEVWLVDFSYYDTDRLSYEHSIPPNPPSQGERNEDTCSTLERIMTFRKT